EYKNCNLSTDYTDYTDFIRFFDLSSAPLFRVGLVKLAEDRHLFLVDMHHIISDGMSTQVLVQDFSNLYSGNELTEIKLQYKDYAEWQNRERVSKKILKQGKYWEKWFEGEIPVLELPADYKRPAVQSFEGDRITFEINKEISGALQALALDAGATVYMVLLSLYTVLLAKLSNQEDIVVGTPVAGRRHADLEKIIGMFVNTLALRSYPSGEKGFMDFLSEVKESTLKAFENQEYQYEDLVEKVSVTRDVSRNPLFDTMFALQNTGSQKIDIPGLKLVPYEYENKTSKFDLTLYVVEVEEKLLLTFEYSTKLFKRKTIERVIGYFKNMVKHIISNLPAKILEAEIISEETRLEILNYFNENFQEKFAIKPIQGIISDIFQKYGKNTAIDYGATHVTYAELEYRVARISQWIANNNIPMQTFIGIYSEDRIDIISAIMAILQRGCIFVPLDTELPGIRIASMIRLTNMRAIMTDTVHEKILKGIAEKDFNTAHIFTLNDSFNITLDLDGNKNDDIKYDLEDKVYVYFTSGTTGLPNAIVGRNKSLVQFLQWEIETFAVNETYRISQLTAVGFDAFLRDVFVPFLAGGAVCIPGNKEILMDGDTLINWLDGNRIDLVHCVPSLFRIILSGKLTPALFPRLKNILLSGEPIKPNELQGWYQAFGERIQLVNYYGPTETTMIKTFHHITMSDIEAGRIPAGRPIKGARTIVLDRHMKICGRGIIGEIYIKTPYRTYGYLNSPELNAERFIKNPFAGDDRDLLHKTGDIGKELESGEIEVLGRVDRQVKIRGVRIELENIENCLLKHNKIEKAVVIDRKDTNGDNYLCAYIVYKRHVFPDIGTAPSASELREHLAGELPDYMIPSYFVPIDKIPLTPNGKIDTKALPDHEIKIDGGYISPRNALEQRLVELWGEILGIEKEIIGIDGNFFELGGHSLKVTTLLSRVHRELDVRVPLAEMFKAPTVRGLSGYIRAASEEISIAVEPAEAKGYYALSSAQKRLHFLQQMDKDGTAYNIPSVMIMEGVVDKERLEQSIATLIRRHESFRTSFVIINEEPVQRIHEHVAFEIEYKNCNLSTDYTDYTDGRGAPPWSPDIIRNFIRPFDLSKAPLLRVGLVRLAEDKHLFLVDMHHIISDGTSMRILIKEFMELYEGRELPQPRLHYKDYAVWESHRQDDIKRQEAYWLREFSEFEGEIPVLDLPLDYVRPKVKNFAGSVLSFNLDGNETRALKTLALQGGGTLYMILLAVYNIFLAKLGNREVIVVGTPTAGRTHADLEQVIGMFVNTLALKNAPVLEKSFQSFLEEVKENTINAFANRDYQYEDLVEKVMPHRDAARNPLFDTMFILQNLDIPTVEIPGLKLGPYPYERNTAKFDLTLICVEIDEHISCTLEYGTQLFKQETIQRFVNYLKKIVTSVLRSPGQSLMKIDMLPEEERKQLVMDFNDTAIPYPGNKTIYQLFEDQVDQFPDHAALVFDDQAVTFRHFDERANRMANYLHSEKQLQPGDRVLVLMDRSIELIIALMAVMKARGAYVPMDVSLPAERLRIVFNDASIGIAVSQQKYFHKIAGVQDQCRAFHSILCMEDLQKTINGYPSSRPTGGDAGDAAYVMYTSGSSGIPKGVLVKHRTIVNTITWRKNNYEYAPGHVSLQVPPYFFDSSVTDIFTPLLGAARLVLIRDDERSDLAVLRNIIAVKGVSHFIVTPVFYNVMLEEIAADLKHIKMICCAGDNFPDELIRKHFERLPQVRIFNEYGPTENSVNSTAYELKPHSPRALIGKPIDNVAVYVLDRNECLAPIGVTGELCLAGASLAVGYLNGPELTKEKFINKSFSGGPVGRFFKKAPLVFYKTGDMGRWLPDGNLEFSGRVDSQVKIRGMRVETGEIENQLMKRIDIKEAVVQVRRDDSGANYLCAYIVPHSYAQVSFEPAGLKEYLSGKLPGYMVPTYFTVLEKLPLTPNGKLDINALPEPQTESVEAYTDPRNDIEKKLVEIWRSVLGKNNIGINDNFFYIGGDSIKSIQIMSRMNGAGYKLEMKDIFQYPVISELAPHVKKLRRIPDQSSVSGPVPLTPIQSAFFNASPGDAHHYNQAVMLYAPAGFDKEAVKKVFIKIQEHHDALRMTYKIDAETGEALQVNHGLDYPLSLREYDLKGRESGLAELGEKVNEVQGSIDLEKGPLMKLGLFHLEDGDRLLIVIHHLVIDGVSWRILLEDIGALYEQILAGEKMVLPPKTDSFKYWAEKLQAYAQHKTLLKEKPYWDHLKTEIVPSIKKDFQADENKVKDTGNIPVNLDEAETALLLNKVNRCYNTGIDDILLTALALAVRKTFGHDRVLISLEGHGRENISREIDIGRTVGWFTTEYPVVIDVSYADNDDPGRQVKEIKETLRKIPNKGIGYGILKYLSRDASGRAMDFKLKPQIIFNYLGQFDAEVGRVGQTSLFQIAREPTGHSQSLNRRREYELEINGMTVNNCLSMTFSYNQTHFKHETIAALTGNFQSELKHIIAFCTAKENSERTPSDFTYKGLTIERLQQMLDVYPDVEDIYTLSPMQEGMLFHALLDPLSHSYFEQTAFRLRGELDIPLVEKSLNELVKRHDVLRTAFVHKETKRPVQVVLKNRAVDFYYRDIGHIKDSEEKESFVREFKANDKKRSFDLSNDTLARASILRLDKSIYEFIWSFHHILMDGWCIGIINNEFFQVYTAYARGKAHRLPVLKPYRTYIQWLEKQDQEESGQYWENYLGCFEEQTGILPPKIKKGGDQTGYSNKKISFELAGDQTKILNELAARHNVTLSTLTQAIWGILLGKYTGKEDVVFGAVVSGRPSELDGVESMVGLFINTIPVRIRFHGAMKFHNLLQTIQAEAIAGEAYHYHPLADIQSRGSLKQNLIDHLFVFENYPIGEQIEGYGHENNKNAELSLTFKLTDADVFEQTNYDLNVILAGSD
ncbi:MAG: hypothetical protein QG657_1172, partial [Acidobacteriota bacterium]|nr:hypothetical protein [Acidobacteriota bacterium]